MSSMKAIVLDLYQTLIYEKDARFYELLVRNLGVNHEPFLSHYKKLGNDSMTGRLPTMAHRVYQACLESKHDLSFTQISGIVGRTMPAYYDSLEFYADATKVVNALTAKGVKLAIASNASSYSWDVINRHAFFEGFSAVVFSCDIGIMKPSPEIYLKTCDALEIPPQECLFWGDGGQEEIRGAREVGMVPFLIKRPEVRAYKDEDFKFAAYVAQSLQDACDYAMPRYFNGDLFKGDRNGE